MRTLAECLVDSTSLLGKDSGGTSVTMKETDESANTQLAETFALAFTLNTYAAEQVAGGMTQVRVYTVALADG
jgi:hypothetical protein